MTVPSLPELLAQVRDYLRVQAPGLLPSHLTIHFFNAPAPMQFPFSPEVQSRPAPAEPERGGLDECTSDILKTLRAAGPLTKTLLIEEMAARNRRGECGEYSDSTICRRLALLMEDETIENPKGARPAGYRLQPKG